MEQEQVPGIDVEHVTAWFAEHIEGARPPLSFRLIAGGRSNLTFEVDDAAGHRFVLRRPPLGELLATAHDMGREHRIIAALGPTPVPVAPALGLCDDPHVTGAPFYVMGFVDGHVLRTAAEAEALLDEAGRRHASDSVVDVLAAIHAVDPDSVGLGDLARKEGYIERQLRRWHGQWQKSKTRELGAVDDLYHQLLDRVPEQGPACIVHGDYRLDNCMLAADGSVAAVLDWEICTLGDPLADLGLLLVYWAEPGEVDTVLTASTALPGFSTREEVAARYAARSGRDVTNLGYYVAFGYWKLACILEGVYRRYVDGGGGGDRSGIENLPRLVDSSVRAAADALCATG